MCVNYKLKAKDIQEQGEKLVEFHGKYAKYFCAGRKDVSRQALEYMKGQLLCQTARRNMNKMATEVTEINEQALANFIGQSTWDGKPIIKEIQEESRKLLCPNGEPGALIVDESGLIKQGKKSVGVARQYCGSIGKVDNCQVGVFIAYTNGHQATLIDKRIYLPKEWTNDPERCRKAGVPEEEIKFRTKAELALEMILEAKEESLPFTFVSTDAHYGEQPWFLTSLENKAFTYVADVPCNTRVYLECPCLGIPERKGSRGKKPKKIKVLEGTSIQVRHLLLTNRICLQPIKIRDTQRGELWVKFAAVRVWRIDQSLPVSRVWLLIRQEIDNSDITFSFSNAPADSSLLRLASLQATRYWVERSLEDAKGLAGLDEYQVTGWRAWHHHMTLVFLCMLFLLYLQQLLSCKAPMLSLQDCREILLRVIPKKHISLHDAVKIIQQKHINRFRSRASRLKAQKIRLQEMRILI